jgi:hypothetical protein
MLMRRAAAPDCAGNVSKAVRTFVYESEDGGMRLRRSIRAELDCINQAIAMLRTSARVPGAGVFVEQIDTAIKRVEQKLAKVSTT